jgi:hypothetical protein
MKWLKTTAQGFSPIGANLFCCNIGTFLLDLLGVDQTESLDEDWEVVMSVLPADWRDLARKTDALKGLRQDKSGEKYLRTLFIHLACGYSLRESVVRAREAHLANLSDVALLKRLRKSEEWLYELCCRLFEETNLGLQDSGLKRRIRLVDATHVKEQGKGGSLWRIHYSLSWPSLRCDYFRLTAVRGQGSGESLKFVPVTAGDCLLADRGYSTASGIHEVVDRKADVILRLNPQGIRILSVDGAPFSWFESLADLNRCGQIKQWAVSVPFEGRSPVVGRVCALRKSKQATELAHKKLREKVYKKNVALEPETLLFAGYVLVFTTLPEAEFSAKAILDWYRVRWQIELVFKRFKQIAQLGHLPKNDPQSARAWLYGKMLVALLVEKLITQAESFSPWGYPLQDQSSA